MAGKPFRDMITVNIASQARVDLARTILLYEGRLLGGSMGVGLRELVMRRVRRGGLPDEVRAQLAEIDAERLRAAVRASVGSAGGAGGAGGGAALGGAVGGGRAGLEKSA